MDKTMVYLEIGKTRSFAGALEWPGWCRSGREETAALQSLFDYGPRYARAIQTARQDFAPPLDIVALSGGVDRCFQGDRAVPLFRGDQYPL